MLKEYVYWLPNDQGLKKEITTTSNSVILIGANGAGKSRLGAWIEQQKPSSVHRIGAQRSLNFTENIPLKSYQESEDLVLFGNATHERRYQKVFKYNATSPDAYITHFFDDFNSVLSALIAMSNNKNTEFVNACKDAERNGEILPHTPETEIDILRNIWRDIFPQRNLIYNDSHFYAHDPNDDEKQQYSATRMSDGERSALYFIAQVLCVPKGEIILVDEPELHLHRSLMNRLWIALERNRKDCLFIYITHDTQFASLHFNADKYWVKSYSGKQLWDLERIDDNSLPEDLLLGLLGNRKNVLFVEGDSGSFDTQLYSLIYGNYYVIPCGSCTQVISRTKAFNNTPYLHHYRAFGIIDRDFRSDYEIKKYQKDNVFSLNVAEVENLFIVEELVRSVANQFGQDSDEVFKRIKKYVLKDRFSNQLDSQICQAVVAEIKYRLESITINNKDESNAKETMNNGLAEIDFDNIKQEIEQRFYAYKESGDYGQVLCVFNEKGISKTIGHFLSIQDKDYCGVIIGMLKNGLLDVETLISNYLPSKEYVPR